MEGGMRVSVVALGAPYDQAGRTNFLPYHLL